MGVWLKASPRRGGVKKQEETKRFLSCSRVLHYGVPKPIGGEHGGLRKEDTSQVVGGVAVEVPQQGDEEEAQLHDATHSHVL